MAVKIRLQRHGKKGKPFYWIVAADSRAKRDGKYLQKLGVYNPNSNPARVEVNVEEALKWLQKGAIPTNTARTLLSYRGVMLKHHLNKGVLKGALKQEKADEQFQAWLKEKESKINSFNSFVFVAKSSSITALRTAQLIAEANGEPPKVEP